MPFTTIPINKSGIDLEIDGIQNTDWFRETYYYDDVLCGYGVTYIRSNIKIGMRHNSNNILGLLQTDEQIEKNSNSGDGYVPAGVNEGRVRFLVDGFQRWQSSFVTWPKYAAPFSFDELNYSYYEEEASPVVGSIGDNGFSLTRENRTKRFIKGMIDNFGNEHHLLRVGSDGYLNYNPDTGIETPRLMKNSEFRASNGKIHDFVVNPKTPAIKWSVTKTGENWNGEFYTTPLKKYFINKVYNQTTFIYGTVSAQIRDIYGNNVFWRIVSDVNSVAPYANAGASFVNLTQDNFADGDQFLQYYYAGNQAHIATRKVKKIPTNILDEHYPSYGEGHISRLWDKPSNWPELRTKLENDVWLKRWRDNEKDNPLAAILDYCRKGRRGRWRFEDKSMFNALCAMVSGNMLSKRPSASVSYMDAAMLEMFEVPCTLDPCGLERNPSNTPLEGRDSPYYRGYRDAPTIIGAASTYSIAAGHYRKNQGYPKGLTPVQDYYFRDVLARFVYVGLFDAGCWGTPDWDYGIDKGGMWPSARKVGGRWIAGIMPSYSTEVYGTSGFDGNMQTWPDNPWPQAQHTWKEYFYDNDVPLTGFPNVNNRVGITDIGYNFNAQAQWLDKVGYFQKIDMQRIVELYELSRMLWTPNKPEPLMDMLRSFCATEGVVHLAGTSANPDNRTPYQRVFSTWHNPWFPDFAPIGRAAMDAAENLSTDGDNSRSKQSQLGGWLHSLYNDHTMNIPTAPPPRLARPQANITPGPQEAPFQLILTHEDAVAVIHFTVDGSIPTTLSPVFNIAQPIPVNNPGATIRSIAVRDGYESSLIQTHVFVYPYGGRPAPISILKSQPEIPN